MNRTGGNAIISVVIKKAAILSIFLIITTVFVASRNLPYGVITAKYFWFYGSVGLFAVCLLFDKCRNVSFSALDFFIIAFAVTVFLSAFVFNDASQNTSKLTIFALIIWLYFLIRFAQNILDRNAIFLFIVLSGLIECCWGILQIYDFLPSQNALYKTTGSLFNPGPFAGYIAATLPLSVFYLLNWEKRWQQYLSASSVFSAAFILPVTMSRAALVAAVIGCGIVVFKKYGYKLHKRQIKAVGFIILTFAMAGMTSLYFIKKDSADGRLLVWKVGLATTMEHPLGVGLGNFSGAFGDKQAEYFVADRGSETEEMLADSPEYAFNEFLQISIESGIAALLIFVAVFFLSVRTLIKTHSGATGSMIAILVFACFSYPFSVLPFLILFVVLTAFAANSVQRKTISINASATIVLKSIIFLFVSYCLIKQYPVYQAYRQWSKIKTLYDKEQYEICSKEYNSLYPALKDNINFLFEYAQSLSKSGHYEESNKVLQCATIISCDPMLYNIMGKNYQMLKQYCEAEQSLKKASAIIPSRLYPYYLLVILYIETGDNEKARETASILLNKEPKIYSPAIREMKEEIEKLITVSH